MVTGTKTTSSVERKKKVGGGWILKVGVHLKSNQNHLRLVHIYQQI